MARGNGYARLTKENLRIRKKELADIFVIGMPIGLSKCTFSIANVIIVSSINALGADVMAANAIVKEFDAFILEALHGFTLASLAIISQNLGAKNMERIKKSIFVCVGLVTGVGVVLGLLFYVIAPALCGIMTDTEAVLDLCMVRILLVGVPYVICGLLNAFQEGIRGLGYSNTALAINLFANIGFRLFWVFAIYPSLYVEGEIMKNYAYVLMVFPTSWLVSAILGIPVIIYLYRKTKNKINNEIKREEIIDVKS
jgi:Na+-driven multidrug efflux pump